MGGSHVDRELQKNLPNLLFSSLLLIECHFAVGLLVPQNHARLRPVAATTLPGSRLPTATVVRHLLLESPDPECHFAVGRFIPQPRVCGRRRPPQSQALGCRSRLAPRHIMHTLLTKLIRFHQETVIQTVLPPPISCSKTPLVGESIRESNPFVGFFGRGNSMMGRGGLMGVSMVAVLLCFVSVAAAGCPSLSEVRTEVFRSPALTFRPGDVQNKLFDVQPPVAGRFATRDFDAELVFENGEPVPLSEVYLHHWVMIEFGIPEAEVTGSLAESVKADVRRNPAHVYHHNMAMAMAGGKRIVGQNWAKGGETRHTNSTIPAPYGLESGHIPAGYHSRWLVNVHGIDTRGTVHRMGCTECRCDLFSGGERPSIPEGYTGGLKCCVDESRCLLRDDVDGDNKDLERVMYLKYTWSYVVHDECVVPLVSMGVDVTDQGQGGTVEYTVEGSCNAADADKPECVDIREATVVLTYTGKIVYTVSHLHAYSLDSKLFAEDGRMLCQSTPIYGHGNAAGDERGYVVGIMHCGLDENMNVKKGEKLRYQVKYTKVDGPHTGVMGVIFIKLAEEDKIVTPVSSSFHNRKIIS